MSLKIRPLEFEDVSVMATAFKAAGWNKPAERFQRYFHAQEAGARVTLVATAGGSFAGYLNVVWRPDYPPLREAGTPEVQDFNVLPIYQRRGIGTRLMEAAEALASERSPVVGIGVGLYADYGPAQILYVRRGYVPDGRGLSYRNKTLAPGETAVLDDDLVLHFTKALGDLTKA